MWFSFRWTEQKMMNYRRIVAAVTAILFLLGLAGCAKQEKKSVENTTEEIVVPMILTVNPTTGKKNEQDLVEAFNQAYQGTYRIEVDWVMETEEEYRKNLKRLNVTDELPAIITDLRMLPSYYQMMIQEGRIEDLSCYINEDSEWKDMIEPTVLESCSEEDGSIYLAPISTAAFACSGVFWNQNLFAEAGIERFPETWEEFWQCCDQLEACGITPLAAVLEDAQCVTIKSTSLLCFCRFLRPSSISSTDGNSSFHQLRWLIRYVLQPLSNSFFFFLKSGSSSSKIPPSMS